MQEIRGIEEGTAWQEVCERQRCSERHARAVLRAVALWQEIKRPVVTREKDGKEQLTTDLAEEVTASEVTETVQKQRKVDLHEQLLFMDPIREAGAAPFLHPHQPNHPHQE